ncbi:hypothetical protein QYF61_010060 [Mycteria americana]|uniref:Uncharacterized protein n=1 Tax=Mycteria americana TaxID=33587 RepID=A0AAN7P5X7_MYCAM|nr:hypothetical protein QYF61_010060 [Mycteria americana]
MGKYQLLHPGRDNPMHQYILGANCLQSIFAEKAWVSKSNMSQQCPIRAKRANSLLSCIRRSITSRDANVAQEDLPADSQSRSAGAVRTGGSQASATAALGRKRLDYGKRK